MTKSLSDLLAGVPHTVLSGDVRLAVRNVVADSRQVKAGDVFVCLPGYRAEGGEQRADRHDYIPQAVANGASALVVNRDVAIPAGVAAVRVDDAWSAIASMAANNYDQPSSALKVIGVTGTSGKTSTTYFIESVMRAAGQRCARFGTIEYRIGENSWAAAQTTPEAPELQRLLRVALEEGCSTVVMEVSSHALELQRVGGIAFDVGVFTNLSQDHLNFHPDMDHYRRAKQRLFEGLGSTGKAATAVINCDDSSSSYFVAANRGSLLTYGTGSAALVRASAIRADLEGTRFTVSTPVGNCAVALPHLGDFHVHNALAAIATGLALNIDLETIARGLAAAPPVPGRFELVRCGQNFRVAVDYAHKPDALERLLRSARQMRPQRILTVFGCGGDRDRGKRPLMGRIAAELSDIVFVTSDNPRSETPLQIIHDILAGARSLSGRADVHVESDRATAIELAIGAAQPGDLVLIAGKGHETYQLFADHRIDFDDRVIARQAIERRLAEKGTV